MNEAPLNIRLKEGHNSAYEEIFKQTFPRMISYCQLFVRDSAQANDLVQDCYLKLWEKRASINPTKSIESLLFVMLRNRCLNYLRDMKIRKSDVDIVNVEDKEAQFLYQMDILGREEISIEEKLVKTIRELVEKLPNKRKAVFNKVRVEGKKIRDVADEMGVSIKAIEKHLYQAKKMILNELNGSH